MRILCLVDWPARGRWLWDYIPGNTDEVEFVSIRMPSDRFPGYGKLLSYYPYYARSGFSAIRRMGDYDVVVAWEGKNGVPLAFLRAFLHRSAPPLVILNFVLKGRVVLDNMWFIRYAARSVDCLTCLSQREIAYYQQQLGIPLERFAKLQGPFVGCQRLPGVRSVGDYIFAAGRSHRDYGTLVEAVRGLPVRLIINARSFNVAGLQTPPNVTVNPFLPYGDFVNLLQGARFAVLPLYAAKHGSGETFMAQAMSLAKPIIVTETYSTAEMIEPGVNGLLVPPGDVMAMRQAIQTMLDDSSSAEAMGITGQHHFEERWSFPAAARQVQDIVARVVGAKHSVSGAS